MLWFPVEMSVRLENGVVGQCVELVDDLRIRDVQVTGLSVPILVRADGKHDINQNEFVENSFSHYSLRNLVQYTRSICKELPLNLVSVLFQHNANPILGYSSDANSTCIRKGGEEENQICSRLAAIFSQVAAPNIVKQLSWFYLFHDKLGYLLPDWNKLPLVLYMLYTITPREQVNQPLCEPTTKWIFCIRGRINIQLLPPTPGNLAVFKKFLDADNEDDLTDLFQSDSIETHLYKNQVIFIPAGWIYFAKREAQTVEYGGEFFHSFAIEHQFGVWHLYEETFLHKSDQKPPPFFTCHWLVLQAYLSSFQNTFLTTQEALFDLQNSRTYLPHFSPFECRGMLFLIELIRSGRLPLLRDCIPSSINCAVSLLQKMQTILLHETIFLAFSCSTPNGIMFFGTPKDDYKYKYKCKPMRRSKKYKAKHSSLPVSFFPSDKMSSPGRLAFSSSYPAKADDDVTDTQDDSSMSISISLNKVQVLPDETSDVTYYDTGSLASNYGTIESDLSKSPNIPSIHSCNSEQSSYLEKETAKWTNVREFLESLTSRSVLDGCGFCQTCKNKNRGFLKKIDCVLKRISNLTITPYYLIKAPPILNKLFQYLSVYPPIAPYSDYMKDILRKKEALTDSPPSPVTEASLTDIQDIMAEINTYSCEDSIDNPVGHSTPLGSRSERLDD